MCRAIEEMVQHHPEAINVQNDEGCTALHLASGLNKREIVSFLLQQVCQERRGEERERVCVCL